MIVIAVLLALAVGFHIGKVAGYSKGWLDHRRDFPHGGP